MRCYACGRRLLRAAATVTTADGTGYAGPACARRLGLLPPKVSRPRLIEGKHLLRKRDARQMELGPA
jgi:hypothetical protein